jgi:hypothetical protein
VRQRIIIYFIAAVAAFWVAWPFVWRYWADTVTSWGTITTETPSFDASFLLLWVLMFVLVAILAAIATVISRPPRRILFGVLVGLMCGATAFSRGTHFFALDSTLASYIWTYGAYPIAILGGMAGAAIIGVIRETPPNTSLERTREG